MEVIEKHVVKHDNEKYATKARANTGIALASALGGAALLSQWAGGNFLNFGGLNGGGSAPVGRGAAPVDVLAKENQDVLDLTNLIYNERIDVMNNRFNDRNVLNAELFGLYKTQIDADFSLYKSQRDGFDILAEKISNLESKVDVTAAVAAAVEPWRAKAIQSEIDGVAKYAKWGLELEAERRSCSDNKIVNYANNTFSPQYIAEMETSNTSNAASTYNPLCVCSLY